MKEVQTLMALHNDFLLVFQKYRRKIESDKAISQCFLFTKPSLENNNRIWKIFKKLSLKLQFNNFQSVFKKDIEHS